MNNKPIIEFGFRIVWRIMEISSISIILHKILSHMHSLIVKYGGVSLSINLYLKLAPVPYATPQRLITNDFLYPSDSKICDRVPRYNETSL